MTGYTLEVCVDSLESAMAAVNGGATRLELCANLVIGGTTPSVFLLREIRKRSDIPINAIIRPRFGDFCYSPAELNIMVGEIECFRHERANGVVIGALTPDGGLDEQAMRAMIGAAGGLSVTLHRAFDMCRDPFAALRAAKALGVATVLTSGGRNTALDGAPLLKELGDLGLVDIMAGGGVNAEVITKLRPLTGLTSYHMSGKAVVDSPMRHRNPHVSMGLPSLSEYQLWRTDEQRVRAARSALDALA